MIRYLHEVAFAIFPALIPTPKPKHIPSFKSQLHDEIRELQREVNTLQAEQARLGGRIHWKKNTIEQLEMVIDKYIIE